MHAAICVAGKDAGPLSMVPVPVRLPVTPTLTPLKPKAPEGPYESLCLLTPNLQHTILLSWSMSLSLSDGAPAPVDCRNQAMTWRVKLVFVQHVQITAAGHTCGLSINCSLFSFYLASGVALDDLPDGPRLATLAQGHSTCLI
jgi:hypothetical protein